ncbi:MAG: hypothetical protein AVO34_08465 [Firmicutes bacterium ML8_F2]|nr:MAG: hypothetical protein AVO34_08465 [Firmicutes bacterium ML8_F2]
MRGKTGFLVLAVLLAVAALLSGCGGDQPAAVSADSPSLIQTYGEAEITAEPDQAKISIAITTRSTSAEEAVEKNAMLANAVLDTLKNYGLANEELKTGSYTLHTYREWIREQPAPEEEIIYYQATNEIIATTDRLDDVGEIVDLAVKAGANNINYISFELQDPQDLLMEALKAATEQASRKAEAIAESAGQKISALHSITEERTEYTPFRMREMPQEEMAMGAASTPITPEDVIIRASVIAEYKF